ncbi:MAG TPA: S1C family serine protease [Gaiellaceae bacterium]|nr:S1C family serine protease [Gaiellaceae bacterium]
MSFLDELQQTIQRLEAEIGPAIVGLGRGWGGTGVVVGDGRVLTNAHNVRGDEVTVTFADGRRETGRVAALDVDGDVAVISADTAGAPAVAWRDDGDVRIGSPVFALANPAGRGLRVTFGLVSATGRSFRGPRGRRVPGSIEHSAPLVRGSSGGPLVDAQGRLLGINTLRLEGSLILALPADESLRQRTEALARGEAPASVRLGVAIAPPRAARRMRRAVGLPEREGLLVRDVLEPGPAASAGLEQGDLIVGAAGQPTARVDDLFRALDAAAGGTLELTVVRGVDERTVAVDLTAEREAA